MAANTAIIAMTTSNSMREKARTVGVRPEPAVDLRHEAWIEKECGIMEGDQRMTKRINATRTRLKQENLSFLMGPSSIGVLEIAIADVKNEW